MYSNKVSQLIFQPHGMLDEAAFCPDFAIARAGRVDRRRSPLARRDQAITEQQDHPSLRKLAASSMSRKRTKLRRSAS